MNMIIATAAMTAIASSVEKLATTFNGPDPIYAAIQTCRDAKRILYAARANPDIYAEELADALWDAYDTFERTVPATLAGVVAKRAFVAEVTDRTPDAFDDAVIFSTFATAAKALTPA
jgi:hypothetical protein